MDLHHVHGIHMDVKGKYLGASGNPTSTALERVRSLSSRVLTYPNDAKVCCVCRFSVMQQFFQYGITYCALNSAPSS